MPPGAKQALPYAKALGAPFIFLTNGELIYFWDYRKDDARQIPDPARRSSSPSPSTMQRASPQYLNERHPEQQGRYAEVITSDVAEPNVLIRRFKSETYPMVAVSVGMLDTGFDCREVLHLVLCRRVRSPILYQQMRGRGTRTAPHIDKRAFVIYDFFRNHQYFNDSDTDVFTGGTGGHAPVDPDGPPTPRELVELGLEDEWLQAVTYVEVGPEGERVDKEQYVSDWQQTIRSCVDDDPLIRKVRDDDPLDADEEESLARRLNAPERYFNEDNLQRAYRNPGGTLIDFIRAALGRLRIKSREERLDEAFRAWLVSRSLTTRQAEYLCLLKNRGIATGPCGPAVSPTP